MRLYLIRHGQTDNNTLHTIGGMRDIPLNQTGIFQAGELCKKLKSKNMDAIYTSGLSRAILTGDILAKTKNIMPVLDKRLNEIDFGDWTGKSFCQIEDEYPELYNIWINHWKQFKAPSGEAVFDVCKRLADFLDEIYINHKNQEVAIVSHQGSLCILLSMLLGIEEINKIRIRNTGCVCIDVNKDTNRLVFLNYIDD